MQKIFLYDNVNNRIELNVPEILLIREFKALMDKKRNITPKDKEGKLGTQAFKEFTYIWPGRAQQDVRGRCASS